MGEGVEEVDVGLAVGPLGMDADHAAVAVALEGDKGGGRLRVGEEPGGCVGAG